VIVGGGFRAREPGDASMIDQTMRPLV